MKVENPYQTPAVIDELPPGNVSYRVEFQELDTKTLKKLRNHSHSIRCLGALALLGAVFVPFGFYLRGGRALDDWGIVAAMFGFMSLNVYAAWRRPAWGRIPLVLFCLLMFAGSILGFAIGIFGLIACANGGPLFGRDRYLHGPLEREWKRRKKEKIA